MDNTTSGVDEELHNLFRKTNADEQKWLIRIILKDLKLGMGQDRILKLYHPDAVDLFTVNNSLSIVCDTLSDLTARLHEIEVSVFSPFRPMLSQRCDPLQFRKVFSKNPRLYIENKFDGERFQLHMENNTFKFFSRNGFDYTSTYGSNYYTGSYTPLLKNSFKQNVRNVILDGEMMGWNKRTNQFGSKGMDFDVKHLKPHNVYQPCFCIFDVIFLNDRVLSNQPLCDRLLLLDTIINPIQGVIMTSHRTEATTEQEVIDSLNRSMDREEEGIVFKDINSLYKSNDRNAGWWKMKLEYFENLMSDLDVIILGGYYGEGKGRNRVTGFLVGVSSGQNQSEDRTPTEYCSFAKIATGLSNDERKILDAKLGPHWRKKSEGNPEDFGIVWGKEKPDVWIPPNDSCVLLVRASELVRATDFSTRYTLRFPRILKIREDKPIYDCLTSTELEELAGTKVVQKLGKRHIELSDLEVVEKERKVRRKYVPNEIKPVESKSEILTGYEFCVLSGYEDWRKDDVEVAIREHGGSVVLVERNATLCILAGDDHPRVNICKQQNAKCDVVKLEWLRKIVNTGKFAAYTPFDLLHTCRKTRDRFLGEYDKYGDSYTVKITVDDVPKIMESVKESKDYAYLAQFEIDNLKQEMGVENSLNVFEKSVAHFHSDQSDYKLYDGDNNFCIEKTMFKLLGGSISEILNESVTIVVIEEGSSKVQEIKQYLNYIDNKDAKIVNKDYICSKFSEVFNA
ncbi:DNA ligase 4 isoform X2 [Photinus pyralis]|uniref:DNA ligase 4 n=1 Tax=Photinus pyralis TaxID=7054 RepID=A0A1Y1KJE4_PHOPY|nr:DNA ligase 4 isoform X2 [Photinus pyralis]XP_031347172.1 DNA ligase 4 isoform X2 [Photinus pyralis]